MTKNSWTLGLALVLSGCVIPYTYKQNLPDLRASEAPTYSKVSPEQLTHNKPYRDISRAKFVVLVADSNRDPSGYTRLVRSALESIGFPEILDEVQFTKRLLDAGAQEAKAGVNDLADLRRAADVLGPYLVVQASLYKGGGEAWRVALTVIDPQGPEIMLKYDVIKIAWISFEKELNYPMFNVLRDWYHASR
jgi:hypothetical protein